MLHFFISLLFTFNEYEILMEFVIGSEIYQETLTKALAKDVGARLLIVESLLLPGVRFFDV